MRIKILGSGQDDGIPHTGCYCDNCNKARKHAEYRRLGPSAAILDEQESFCCLIDASPDFKHQLDIVKNEIGTTKRSGATPISAILLTHAHLGHCAGLWHLGKESVEERNLPVFCTSKMKTFLRNNYPFSLLVQRNNITINEVNTGKEFQLDGLRCTPFSAPHRDEIADTVGYIIEYEKRIIYLPDVDRWTKNIVEEIQDSDIAFVDGTFYSKNEILRSEEVPHPPIQETIDLLKNVEAEIYLTHINHTNPVNKIDEERKHVESEGFHVAYDGLIIEI